MDPKLQAYLSKIAGEHREINRKLASVEAQFAAYTRAIEDQPRSITAELDSIPGRRIFYNLCGNVLFTALPAGTRGQPINFLVSQDGPFVMTHYPVVMWRPSLPLGGTNLGIWRPIYTWPLPDQVVDNDLVDLLWEIQDGGSQRFFQSEAAPPTFSRPDGLIPLPVPTLFEPNTLIVFTPTYSRIQFGGDVPTTEGQLHVALPGYRIVNM